MGAVIIDFWDSILSGLFPQYSWNVGWPRDLIPEQGDLVCWEVGMQCSYYHRLGMKWSSHRTYGKATLILVQKLNF